METHSVKLAAMDVGSNNPLYAIDTDQAGASEVLVTVAKAGGALTTIGSTGIDRLDALAIPRAAVIPAPAPLALIGLGLLGMRLARRSQSWCTDRAAA